MLLYVRLLCFCHLYLFLAPSRRWTENLSQKGEILVCIRSLTFVSHCKNPYLLILISSQWFAIRRRIFFTARRTVDVSKLLEGNSFFICIYPESSTTVVRSGHSHYHFLISHFIIQCSPIYDINIWTVLSASVSAR